MVRFLVHLQYQYGTALYLYYRPSDNANDLELEFPKDALEAQHLDGSYISTQDVLVTIILYV